MVDDTAVGRQPGMDDQDLYIWRKRPCYNFKLVDVFYNVVQTLLSPSPMDNDQVAYHRS
jgi:hypothetical protein